MNDILKEIDKLNPEEQSAIALKIQASFEAYDNDYFTAEQLATIEDRIAKDESGQATYVPANKVMSSLWLKFNSYVTSN